MIKKIKQSILIKSTIVYMLTRVVNSLIPFLLIPILTIYLSPSDYGITSTFTAMIAILVVFNRLSMSGAVNVNFFKLSKQSLKIYIGNVIIIAFVTTVFLFCTIYLFQDSLSHKLEIPKIWLYIGLFLACIQFFSELNLGLWQSEQHPKPFAIYQITMMLVGTIFVLFLVVGLNMGWEGKLTAQAISTTIFSLISFWFLYQRGYLQFKIDKKYIADALKFGVPLIPHALSGWFKMGIDRIFLTMIVGTSATGLYSVGYQFGFIVGMVALAFNQAYSPYLYKKLTNITEEGKRKLVKLTYLYFVGILLFAGIISVIMPLFVAHFLNIRYNNSIEYIPWIAFGYAFQGMYLMVVNYIFYIKRTYILSLITFSAGVLHVVLSYILINKHGSIGAAQATTLSFFITFVCVWWWSAKVYKMPWVKFLRDSRRD